MSRPFRTRGPDTLLAVPRAGVIAWLVLAASVALAPVAARATPRLPSSDEAVLERVPALAASRGLEPLRERLAASPQDLHAALELAQGYLQIGRASGDPRFVSYTQATLAPWLRSGHPAPEVLVLDASALQYLHRFDAALAELDRALALRPESAQAWITKATILQVQGRFDEARRACVPLVRLSGPLTGLACLSGTNSLTGQLPSSYAALRQVFANDDRLPSGLRLWVLEQLADMEERLGDERGAETHLQQALAVDPTDGYVKAQYADLLLRQQRDAEVLGLLSGDSAQDNLLLRLAIAGMRTGDPRAVRWANDFQARYEAARRDGDNTHLREQARFLLTVRGRAAEALALARLNWRVQHEPADVRVYLEAAEAAASADATAEIRAWIRDTHYEDHTLGGVVLASGAPR